MAVHSDEFKFSGPPSTAPSYKCREGEKAGEKSLDWFVFARLAKQESPVPSDSAKPEHNEHEKATHLKKR